MEGLACYPWGNSMAQQVRNGLVSTDRYLSTVGLTNLITLNGEALADNTCVVMQGGEWRPALRDPRGNIISWQFWKQQGWDGSMP